ncbi:hypothetical protein L1887_34410 [Cichorium endivia]|nr:hypothetical protein L1887_34410 [Cichorium endivia]
MFLDLFPTLIRYGFMGRELTRVGKENKLKGFEFVKAVHLDPVPFDMERDHLKTTFNKKRPQLLKYCQSVIDNTRILTSELLYNGCLSLSALAIFCICLNLNFFKLCLYGCGVLF